MIKIIGTIVTTLAFAQFANADCSQKVYDSAVKNYETVAELYSKGGAARLDLLKAETLRSEAARCAGKVSRAQACAEQKSSLDTYEASLGTRPAPAQYIQVRTDIMRTCDQ